MRYEFKLFGVPEVDELVKVILDNDGRVISDHYSGQDLYSGVSLTRVVSISMDFVIIRFSIINDECFLGIQADDKNRATLLEDSKVILKNKEVAIATIREFNDTVKLAIEGHLSAARARSMVSPPNVR